VSMKILEVRRKVGSADELKWVTSLSEMNIWIIFLLMLMIDHVNLLCKTDKILNFNF